MYCLTYVSSAVEPFSREALRELLQVCVANNSKLGITGMLLYKDGNFMQVLEGEQSAVTMVREKVFSDPRHRGVITLIKGEQEGRDFPDWSMGFHDLSSPEAARQPGYSAFLNTPLTAEAFMANPTRCRKLLLTFKKTM